MGFKEVGEARTGTCRTWIRLGENPLGRRVLINGSAGSHSAHAIFFLKLCCEVANLK